MEHLTHLYTSSVTENQLKDNFLQFADNFLFTTRNVKLTIFRLSKFVLIHRRFNAVSHFSVIIHTFIMREEINHKTIFVLDHTPYFGIPSGSPIDLDLKNKTVSPGTIQKSLWTLAVESTVEYCRIVYDVFPTGKLIRFIVSDTAAHIVNTWNTSTQNLNHILNAMSMVGVPLPAPTQNAEFTVMHGLRAAIEALAEPTEIQTNLLASGVVSAEMLQNQGRIICITSARDDASMKTLEEIFHSVLIQQNSQLAKNKSMLTVSKCQLLIINMFPNNLNEKLITARPMKDMSPLLSTEILSIRGPNLPDVLTHLILDHFDLASTTVTGIPMKEEQNASSSANYDVEIFHSRSAHSVILGSELVLPKSIKEGAEYQTVTLKWCTPRGCNSSEMQNCIAQNRVTCSDVTSRPSSCLINFLLAGRSVLLEMPRKTGGKLTSHLLSAHGGEIFIHTLSVSRSCLEELPSISEGIGGRNVNYRIHEFGALMQRFKLVPKRVAADTQPDDNLSRLRRELERATMYFPLTLGSTIVFNIRQFLDLFLNNLNKPEMSDEEVVQCKQVIYQLVALEARQEPLPLPSMSQKMTTKKKEDQYRLLWTELEILASSSGKTVIVNCIRECRSRSGTASGEEKEEGKETTAETGADRKGAYRQTAPTESPLSPTMEISGGGGSGLLAKKPKLFNENRSLFDMVTSTERVQNQKRLDFSGRLNTAPNQIAKLYVNPVVTAKPAVEGRVERETEHIK